MSERFAILQHLASRKAAEVYLADDLKKGYQVRLRRIRSSLEVNQLQGGLEYLKVLKRQYSQLESPSLLPVDDFGVDEQGLWVSVPIDTYKGLLKHHHQAMTTQGFRLMAEQLLNLLAKAHDVNLIHGAISPNTIEVVLGGAVPTYRFMNFGYRRLYCMIHNPVVTNELAAEAAITAPELFDLSEEADPASDVYMLGQVFYMMLNGWHPWADLQHQQAFDAHQGHQLTPLFKLHKTVPKDLSDWIDKMTQPDPLKRPKDAQEALDLMPPAEASIITSRVGVHSGVTTAASPVKGLIGDSNPPISGQRRRKKIPPHLLYGLIGLVGAGLAVAVIFMVKGLADSKSEISSEEVPDYSPPSAEESTTPVVPPRGQKLKRNVRGLIEAGDDFVLLRPVLTGTVSGGDHFLNKGQMRVGSNNRGDNFFGKGLSSDSKESDRGNTWRSAMVFKNTSLLGDVAKLGSGGNAVDIELAVPVNQFFSKGPRAPMPMMGSFGVSLSNEALEGLVDVVGQGPNEVRGIYHQKVIYFRFYNLSLDWVNTKYFGSRIRLNRKANPGEYLTLNKNDCRLRVMPAGELKKFLLKKAELLTQKEAPQVQQIYREDPEDQVNRNGRYVGPLSLELSSNLGDKWCSDKDFLDGDFVGKKPYNLHTKPGDPSWGIVDLQQPRYIERVVLTNDPSRVRMICRFSVAISEDKKKWQRVFSPGGYQADRYFFPVKRKLRYLKLYYEHPFKGFLAFKNIAFFTVAKESTVGGLLTGPKEIELSSQQNGGNNFTNLLDPKYSGGSNCNLHTKNEEKPWFIIDLKKSMLIDRMIFYKRKNHFDRGTTFEVFTSEDKKDWKLVTTTDDSTISSGELEIPVKGVGRFIRVVDTRKGRVFINLRNIAIYRTVSQK